MTIFRRYISVVLFIMGISAPSISVWAGKINKQDAWTATKLYHKALIESNMPRKITLLKQSYSLNPKDTNVGFLFGKVLLQNHKHREGKDILNKISKKRRHKIKVYQVLGEYYFENHDMVQANHYFKKIIRKKGQNNYINNHRLGHINSHSGLKNYRKSNSYYLRAYKLRKIKEDHDILYSMAENYHYMGKYKTSIKYLHKYPHTNKNDQKAFRLLITNYINRQQYKEANKQIKKYTKIWPSDPWIHQTIWAMKQKKLAKKSQSFISPRH